jgi:16S rRNA U1498 N3-methylase RsmE
MPVQSNEKLFTTSEVLELLKLPNYRLDYLFKSRRLNSNDFINMGNGRKLFRESDIVKIKQLLFETQNR